MVYAFSESSFKIITFEFDVLIIGVELPILYVQYESKDCRTKRTGIRSVIKVGKVRETNRSNMTECLRCYVQVVVCSHAWVQIPLFGIFLFSF